jgi:hypothetical protein
MADVSGLKKTNIRWDDDLKYKLANAAMKYRGYKLDDKNIKKPMRMETKWEKIRDHLLNDNTIDESFKNNPPSAKSLQTSFHRFVKEVLKAAGISEEGANLSGLEETPTDYQQLMINIGQEIDNAKSAKRFEKEKEEKKKRLILTHENDHLLQQRKLPVNSTSFTPAKRSNSDKRKDFSEDENEEFEEEDFNLDESAEIEEKLDESDVEDRGKFVTPRNSKSSSADSALSSGTTVKKSSSSFINMLIDLTKEDPKLIEAELADKKHKRENDQEEHNQKME